MLSWVRCCGGGRAGAARRVLVRGGGCWDLAGGLGGNNVFGELGGQDETVKARTAHGELAGEGGLEGAWHEHAGRDAAPPPGRRSEL